MTTIDIKDPAFDRLRSLSRADAAAERERLTAEARDILHRSDDALNADDEARFTEVTADLEFLRHIDETRQSMLALCERGAYETGSDTGAANRQTAGTGSVRDAAMRVLDRAIKAREIPEHAAEKVEGLLSDGSHGSQSFTARWAVAAGDDNYKTAFAKLCADPERGHLLWEPAEAEAFRRVAAVQAEQRAMAGGAGTTGGYMVPLVLDPAIMLTSDGSINPLRQISRVVQTAGAQWEGVTSAGVTAEWKAEAAQVADASPTLGQPNIPVFFGDAFVPYSFEVGMDAVNFLAELQRLLVDGADQLMNTAYTTGTGTGQPKGVITALVGGASVVTGGGTEALVSADPFTVQNALPPRFQARAQWTANLSTINTLRQFETTNGALKFPELANTPPSLLNRRINELSNMDGSINPAATENNYVLLYGDFQQFVIVDRIGTTLELIPNLMGPNNRPTGQRGALLWFRTGSDVVVPNAFRLLNVPTTA